ncbi:vinorine synthase-like [Chenopodium quinoa]|uniref:vinorine synthase-like n=1 Tax=Chenopodium quinoa TaxID=63459 RepID=UPI000B76E292|nr:vinorine synthase-like [Chenopodium quinoa]
MEQEFEVQVNILSKEMVKPSFPPSSHPTTFTLSLIDQTFPTLHVPVLLFYTAESPTPQGGVDINGLKTSLSQTLDQFLPLAGRLLDESTISCNHKGIPFIKTKVNCHLSFVTTSPHKLNFITKFLPPPELQASGSQLISELVPLAFQINVFLCGGVVIGCYMLHKLLDIASLGTFLKYWSNLASNRLNDVVQPNFEATINAFPPLPKPEYKSSPISSLEPRPISNNVIKSFIFDPIAINKLKAKATSELVPKPTTFEAVAGFVWEQTLATRLNLGIQVEHTALSIVVNMRPRMNPPLPRESMGNPITISQTQVHEHVHSELQELVKEIHSTLYNFYQKFFSTNFKGKNAKDELQHSIELEDGILRVSSWCKMGLNEVDFGFGKPTWIVPTDGIQPPQFRNFFVLTDYCHSNSGDGIEAWLVLEEKEMQNLESNPYFLAFASPN